MKLTSPLGGIQQVDMPKTAAKSVTQIFLRTVIEYDYEKSDQVCFRLKAEVGLLPWGSFVDLHWSTVPHSYAPDGNRIMIAGYRPAQEFLIERSSCAHRFGDSN